MTLNEVPDGLAPMQYAARLCEDLGLPSRSNIQMIGEAIEAVSKSKLFRGRPDSIKIAYYWLDRRVMTARQQGAKINSLWFHGGEYWNVEKPEGVRGDYNNCDTVCKTRHGKGYDYNDVKWVMVKYFAHVKAGGSRTCDDFFKELDSKRQGGPPDWKRNA